MATNFPTGLDALTNPTSTDTLNSPSHADQHANVNDAVEALEAKVGVNGSAVTTSHTYKIAGLEGKQYVTLASDSQLSSERVLTAGTGITVTDAGAGSTVTVATSAVLPTVVDAKGDLIVGSAADAVARLGVGSNGDLLVADSTATNGLRWQGQSNSGRNAIINGGFDVWQRGTSFSNPANLSYLADRFFLQFDGSGATRTISRQTFTPGSAPVSEYEAPYFLRFNQSIAGSGATYTALYQSVEDVRTFAGRTVTVSFYAKADSARNVTLVVDQRFGTGGSTAYNVGSSTFTLSTSWARYSWTFTMSSISGKTIGTDSHLWFVFSLPVNTTYTIDFWGVQLEQGSVAARFEELPYAETLRKCQRYYYRATAAADDRYCICMARSATTADGVISFPVQMRTKPTALEQTGTAADYGLLAATTANNCSSVPTFVTSTTNFATTRFTLTTGLTASNACLAFSNVATGYLGWSAEL